MQNWQRSHTRLRSFLHGYKKQKPLLEERWTRTRTERCMFLFSLHAEVNLLIVITIITSQAVTPPALLKESL